jgi:hypothetical protein
MWQHSVATWLLCSDASCRAQDDFLTKRRVYVVKTRVKMPIEKNTEQNNVCFGKDKRVQLHQNENRITKAQAFVFVPCFICL